jgi:GTP-binding protein EngB required for normal cell division
MVEIVNKKKKEWTYMKSEYFIENAELGAVFVMVDGIEYQVDTSELDLNHIIEDISSAGGFEDLSEYLHETKTKELK